MAIRHFFGSYIYDKFSHKCMVKNFNVNYWSGSIDFNGVIHSCLDEIKQNVEKYTDVEFHLINKIKKKLKSIVDQLRIVDTLLICTDGLVPQAKMNDQRSRRYNFDGKHIEQIGDFYRSSITPRTKFMKKLDREMRIFLNKEPLASNIIYSSDLEMGEGEHKIINYYRKWKNSRNHENHVIYGLDADLILLCLCCPLKNIFIKREDKKEYLDINILRRCIIKEFKHEKNNKKNIINDFLVLTFFVGNDFIKKVPYFSDLRFGMDCLTEMYLNNEICLTKDNKIDHSELIRFFKILSKEEKTIIKRAKKAKFNKYEYYSDINEFSEKWYDRCFLPRKPELFDELGIEIVYGSKQIKDMTEMYVETFYWIFNYYTKGISSINFNHSYLYYYAPLFHEMYKFCQDKTYIYKEKTKIPSIATQLVYVLPPQISDVIENKLSDFYDNESTSYMFPIKGYMDKDLNTETEIIYIFSVIDELDKLVRKKVGNSYDHKIEDIRIEHNFGTFKLKQKKSINIKAESGFNKYYNRR